MNQLGYSVTTTTKVKLLVNLEQYITFYTRFIKLL